MTKHALLFVQPAPKRGRQQGLPVPAEAVALESAGPTECFFLVLSDTLVTFLGVRGGPECDVSVLGTGGGWKA